jgi:hypothetical protein
MEKGIPDPDGLCSNCPTYRSESTGISALLKCERTCLCMRCRSDKEKSEYVEWTCICKETDLRHHSFETEIMRFSWRVKYGGKERKMA